MEENDIHILFFLIYLSFYQIHLNTFYNFKLYSYFNLLMPTVSSKMEMEQLKI